MLLFLLALAAAPVDAAPRPEVTILFLGPDIREPVNDPPPRPSVTVRHFRIRIDARGVRARGAVLHAALAAEVPGRRVRIDGITLGTAPQVIAVTPLAEPTSHAIEIEALAPGAPEETIIWTAEVR